MHKHLTYFLLVFFSMALNAQTCDEVLKNTSQYITAQSDLTYDTTYRLYKTATSSTIHEQYKGVYNKTADHKVYCKIENTEFISNQDVSITISHAEKIVQLSSPSYALGMSSSFDSKALKKEYKDQRFIDKGEFWEIVLVPNSMTTDYQKIVLHVSKQYQLRKQVFYYAKGIDFSSDYRTSDVQYPRLEITYNNYNNEIKDHKRFNTSQYVTLASNNTKTLVPHLSNYELLDVRQQ